MLLNRQEDMHIHCNYNDHSDIDLTAPNIIRVAEEKNLKRIAVTEHVRRSSEWTSKYLAELNSLIPTSRVKIVPGFEAKILQNGKALNDIDNFYDGPIESIDTQPLDPFEDFVYVPSKDIS